MTDEPDLVRAAHRERRAHHRHDRAARWMHWINFPLLTVMIWSGLRIYWANDVYRIGAGDITLFAFFPAWFNEPLNLNAKLARGMAFHFSFGWFFAINGLAYGAYLLRRGNWRRVFPDGAAFRMLVPTLLHEVGLRRQPPPQREGYNAAQRFAYGGVIVLGALALATGFAIFKPTQLAPLTALFGGYESARAIHFIVTILFMAFFAVHLLQVARAGLANFWSMVTGYELEAPVVGTPARDEASAQVGARR